MVVKERTVGTAGPDSKVHPSVPMPVYPSLLDREILLEREWMRQANRLAGLFARQLNKTKKEYIDELPKFTSQPERFRRRLDTRVIVEARIPIGRQLELAGISCKLNGLVIGQHWRKDPRGYITPYSPYVTWTDKGVRSIGKKVMDVRDELADFERGGTVFDGVAVYIAFPDILERQFLDLPGSSIAPGELAGCLILLSGRPCLTFGRIDVAHPESSSLICARK